MAKKLAKQSKKELELIDKVARLERELREEGNILFDLREERKKLITVIEFLSAGKNVEIPKSWSYQIHSLKTACVTSQSMPLGGTNF